MVHELKCVGVTVQAHAGMQVCAGPYYSNNTWINNSWLLDWPTGFVELATASTRPQPPWLPYVGVHEICCLWMHGGHKLCQWLRRSSLFYTFHCETSMNMHWSWMLTFWTSVTSVKGQGMQNYGQQLSFISCFDKGVCHILKSLNFPTDSSVNCWESYPC